MSTTGSVMYAEPDDVPRDTPTVRVALDDLDMSGALRLDGEDSDHVERLVQLAADLPPIVVHRATMRVIDGHHRVRAARRRGYTQVWARMFAGDDSEAFVLGLRLNASHGLPLTLSDRKAAAQTLVGIHPEWSDRSIAVITGLAARTVAGLRSSEAGNDGRRFGRDGRARPVDRAARRAAAADLIREDPSASLRSVAGRVGLSPETVRSVRAEVDAGCVPELPAPYTAGMPAPGPVGTRAAPARDRGPAVSAARPDVAARSDGSRRTRETAAAETAAPETAAAETAARTGRAVLRSVAPASPERRTETAARTDVRTDVLRADPSLRYSSAGRTLIRLLEAHRFDDASWQQLLDSVPAYCADVVASNAQACARQWMQFAEQVARRGAADWESAS